MGYIKSPKKPVVDVRDYIRLLKQTYENNKILSNDMADHSLLL